MHRLICKENRFNGSSFLFHRNWVLSLVHENTQQSDHLENSFNFWWRMFVLSMDRFILYWEVEAACITLRRRCLFSSKNAKSSVENRAFKSLLLVIDNKKEEALREMLFKTNLRLKEILFYSFRASSLHTICCAFVLAFKQYRFVAAFFLSFPCRVYMWICKGLCSPEGGQINPRH